METTENLEEQKVPSALEEKESAPPVIERHFTIPLKGKHPAQETNWIERIVEGEGQPERLSVPVHWSERSISIAYKHYMSAIDQHSIKRMLSRVYTTITNWGIEDGVFETETEAQVFEEELAYVLLNRLGTFNSPVWYNMGVEKHPLLNACFLNSVEDCSESITDLACKEVNIFKWGAGTGCNWSKLRSSKEKVRGGGNASGPVSFMIANDVEASKWKSGGKHRRAARLDRLDIHHPDVLEFIEVKRHYENMVRALVKAGWSTDMNDPLSTSNTVPMQSTNISVGLSDVFLNAVENDEDWPLVLPTTGEVHKVIKARAVMRLIAECAHDCGDPGVQFSDTINQWSFIKDITIINTSNPCQWANATILTPEGIRQFKDIDVGSVIWSGRQWTKVTKKTYNGRKTVYAYYTTAGTFYGTKNHHVISNGKKVRVKDAEAIDICCANYNKTDEKLDLQDIMDGFVVGDGSVHRASNDLIVLYIGEHDTECTMGELISLMVKHRTGINEYAWEIKTTLKPRHLCSLPKRKVPAKFRKGSELKIRGFLRGLYSANGSVCGGRVTLKATSFKIIEAVQEMLSSLGISSYYTINNAHDVKFKNGIYRCKKSYDLNITRDRNKFRESIGFIQEAKRQWLHDACKTPLRSGSKKSYEIKGKKNLGRHDVWDITVDAPEHTYWTGGLLVSNCGEVFNADNVSCNLANMNLLPSDNNPLGDEDIIQISKLFTTALDIMLDHGRYPSPIIEETTKAFRPLGVGWCNLGAAILAQGWPYDSREGRLWASHVTSLTTVSACQQSMKIAKRRGPFTSAEKCSDSTSHVLRKHLEHAPDQTTRALWQDLCLEFNKGNLLRNSALTCAMPTGTTGLLLDAETTGPEPLVNLEVSKKLSYGGNLTLTARCLVLGLKKLGYQNPEDLSNKILANNSAVGLVQEKHLPVFDTALNDAQGRYIKIDGHLKMLAAIQPNISMGISKTVNMPSSCTVEDIERTYMDAWRLGLKSLAVYRDGSKAIQIYGNDEDKEIPTAYAWGERKPLPHTRIGLIHKFDLDGTEVYLSAGMYEDGRLGEIWMTANKHGATITGLLDSVAIAVSMALQHGAPLDHLASKFKGMKFSPAGFCEGSFYTSLVDYVFRWLEDRFPGGQRATEENTEIPPASASWSEGTTPSLLARGDLSSREMCPNCGEFMIPNGVCQLCLGCGGTFGGCG